MIDGVVVEKYLWQGRTRLLAVYDGSDNLLMRFEYADGRMPVAMNYAGAIYYLTYDQVGSLRLISDASGNVVKQIDYDSFGYILTDTNTSFTVSFGFAGGLHDRETGRDVGSLSSAPRSRTERSRGRARREALGTEAAPSGFRRRAAPAG